MNDNDDVSGRAAGHHQRHSTRGNGASSVKEAPAVPEAAPDRQRLFRRKKKSKADVLEEMAAGAIPVMSTEYASDPPPNRERRTMIYIWGERVFSPQPDTAELSVDGGSLHMPMKLDHLAKEQIVAASVGSTHALILSAKGCLYAFGTGERGQLGLGPRVLFTKKPVAVEPLGRTVSSIACGDQHSVCLCNDGQVFCWGVADCVGNARRVDCTVPTPVQYLRWTDGSTAPVAAQWACTAIAARFGQTVAVNGDRELFTWGHTFSCRYYMTPCRTFTFPHERAIVKIGMGRHFALALTDDGKIFAWGDGTYGEVGQLNCENDWLTASSGGPNVPSLLPLVDAHGNELSKINDIAVGARHALLLSKDGRVWAYGENFAGQCGAPLNIPRIAAPTLVRTVGAGNQMRATGLVAGHRHSACLANGALFLWGHSSHHKLVHTASAASLIRVSDNRSQDGGPPMGVSVRSGLKESVAQPRLVYSLLQSNVTVVALGENVSIIVTGVGVEEIDPSPPITRRSFRFEVQSDIIGWREGVAIRHEANVYGGDRNRPQLYNQDTAEVSPFQEYYRNDNGSGTDSQDELVGEEAFSDIYEILDENDCAPVPAHDNDGRYNAHYAAYADTGNGMHHDGTLSRRTDTHDSSSGHAHDSSSGHAHDSSSGHAHDSSSGH
eukprot:Lankesteria_metandrocarpae@DN4150_c0_g1_i1.p1